MIFWFSGTGNSHRAAKLIAEVTGDTLFSMNERIKANDTSAVDAGGKAVFVFPTYAWRIPRVLEAWLEKTEIRNAAGGWFVMTCGGSIGDAGKHNRLLCEKKNIPYMGTAGIVMPENYIAMFDAPGDDEAKIILEKTAPVIRDTAELIRKGSPIPEKPVGLPGKLMSGAVNAGFYAMCVKAKAFHTTDTCSGCGQCVTRCPLNNIHLENGKPVWGKNCTHCMACICRCPAEAIEYGKKSVGRPRYHID